MIVKTQDRPIQAGDIETGSLITIVTSKGMDHIDQKDRKMEMDY